MAATGSNSHIVQRRNQTGAGLDASRDRGTLDHSLRRHPMVTHDTRRGGTEVRPAGDSTARVTATRRRRLIVIAACVLVNSSGVPAFAQSGGTEAEAEAAVQGYLAVWSRNDAVTAATVDRFYAPQVVYYGKHLSREGVLADKRAYIKTWPERSYREVPGTFVASCNFDRSLCRVRVDMAWRRVSRAHAVSTGRAHMRFDFVPADGARKIAREGARLAGGSRG